MDYCKDCPYIEYRSDDEEPNCDVCFEISEEKEYTLSDREWREIEIDEREHEEREQYGTALKR